MEPLPKCPWCGSPPTQCADGPMFLTSCSNRKCVILPRVLTCTAEEGWAAWSTRNGIPPAAPTEVPSGGVAGAAKGHSGDAEGGQCICGHSREMHLWSNMINKGACTSVDDDLTECQCGKYQAAEGVRVWECENGCCQKRSDDKYRWTVAGAWVAWQHRRDVGIWNVTWRELLGTELAAVIGEVGK